MKTLLRASCRTATGQRRWAGHPAPTGVTKAPDRTDSVAGLIDALVNVRTGGETLLCATWSEQDYTEYINAFTARF